MHNTLLRGNYVFTDIASFQAVIMAYIMTAITTSI